MLVVTHVWGQTNVQGQKTVSGKVTDDSGEGIPGVNVVIKGTIIGSITDFDGNYQVSVDENSTLVFSFVGFASQEIEVGTRSVINIALSQDVRALDEVVVVGYGTQKKENLTGAVSSINSESVTRQQVFQTSQALQGLAPGLTAIQSSGQPGSDNASLRIRGIGSFRANRSPLIIIDGVEGDIDGVDPNDIASISVLKDAGSAAIYGNRGSNGVVLITTKRGEVGKTQFSYNTWTGIQKETNQPDVADAFEYLKATGVSDADIEAHRQGNATDPDRFANTDWVSEIFTEPGFQQYHQVGATSGTEKVKVAATLSYMEQNGNIKLYNFRRINGRVNTDLKINEIVDFSLDVNFRQSETTTANAGLTSIVRDAYSTGPNEVSIYSDGRFSDGANGKNPVSALNQRGTALDEANYFRGILKINIRPVKGFTISALYSPEYFDSFYSRYSLPAFQYSGFDATKPIQRGNTSLTQRNNRGFDDNFTATATYAGTFGDHDLSVIGGFEVIKNQDKSLRGSARNFDIVGFELFDFADSETENVGNNISESGLRSLFARVNYTYKDKYLLEANIRRDESSRFAPGFRVGVFPSVSAAWRIIEEPFLNNVSFISDLKIRAAWGQLGNQRLNNADGDEIFFPFASLFDVGNGYVFGTEPATTAALNNLANPEISWETAETINVGLDFGLINNRLTGTVEYYQRDTKDLLQPVPLPGTSGFAGSLPAGNVGAMRNTGVDISLAWKNSISNDFSYGISGNVAFLKNEVRDIGDADRFDGGGDTKITRVGDPINSIWGFVNDGTFQTQEEIDASHTQFGTLQPGDWRYKDLNDDGKITNDDRTIIGNSLPTLTYGFNINVDYKGFDLTVATIGVGKRDVLLRETYVLPLFLLGNIPSYILDDSWSEENPDAYWPRLTQTSLGDNNGQTNSKHVFSAAYLRVRNITLGYSLPSQMLEKVFMSRSRIYASIQNPITINNDLPPGIDPTIPNESAGAIYPLVKSYVIGLNLNF